MKPVSFVIRFYNQPLMLRHQLETINAYPVELREKLHVVIVDDGSRDMTAVDVIKVYGIPNLASFRLFRTTIDIRWNQEFATNLGVSQVTTDWLLHLDIDHECPPDTLRHLIEREHDSGTVYLFQRQVAATGTHRTMAPGLWFITKALFDRAGGLDERFAGRYYPSDRDFMTRLERRAHAKISVLKDALTVYDESQIADASACLEAPHIVDAEGELQFAKIVEARGDRPTWRLTYPWEQIR